MEDKGLFSWLMELLSGLYGASGERSGARNPNKTAPFTRERLVGPKEDPYRKVVRLRAFLLFIRSSGSIEWDKE